MWVGAAIVELRVHGSRSLKEKRGVVRRLLQRLRNRMNVSAAEVGGQDTWQRAVLGVVAVGHDRVKLRGVLERAVEFVEGTGLAEVVGSDVELLALPFDVASDPDADEDDPWET
jgi:hypothetical protein